MGEERERGKEGGSQNKKSGKGNVISCYSSIFGIIEGAEKSKKKNYTQTSVCAVSRNGDQPR
jgi:uncharacterized protein Veg